jgi:hypothetical protein
MRMRHSDEFIRRRLLAKSAVDGSTPVINGCRCRKFGGPLRRVYGRMWDGTRLVGAHRLSHEVNIGPIPDGKDVLHRCDEPACIEQEHLWAGTVAENMADRDAKGRNGGWKTRGHNRPAPHLQGSKHPLSKLDEGSAREIKRRLRRTEDPTCRPAALAREFGVSDSLVRGIEAGRNWSWL